MVKFIVSRKEFEALSAEVVQLKAKINELEKTVNKLLSNPALIEVLELLKADES